MCLTVDAGFHALFTEERLAHVDLISIQRSLVDAHRRFAHRDYSEPGIRRAFKRLAKQRALADRQWRYARLVLMREWDRMSHMLDPST
jgi:hypothetical protein